MGIRRTIHQQRHAKYNAHGKGDKAGWKLPADIIMARMSANLENPTFRSKRRKPTSNNFLTIRSMGSLIAE